MAIGAADFRPDVGPSFGLSVFAKRRSAFAVTQCTSAIARSSHLSGVQIRYVHDHPGALVHQDHKKLGRIPPGGGHRFLGRSIGLRNRAGAANGYDHFEVVVDDMSRFACVAPRRVGARAVRALLDAAIFFAEWQTGVPGSAYPKWVLIETVGFGAVGLVGLGLVFVVVDRRRPQ